MNEKLAYITDAKLEMKERGVLNFWIFVDYEDGMSQGVGGFCLDTWDGQLGERIGTAYGCEMIRQLLLCLGVNDFSEMKGQHIWVLGQGGGLSFSPRGVQALRSNGGKEVVFEDVYDMFSEEFV